MREVLAGLDGRIEEDAAPDGKPALAFGVMEDAPGRCPSRVRASAMVCTNWAMSCGSSDMMCSMLRVVRSSVIVFSTRFAPIATAAISIVAPGVWSENAIG